MRTNALAAAGLFLGMAALASGQAQFPSIGQHYFRYETSFATNTHWSTTAPTALDAMMMPQPVLSHPHAPTFAPFLDSTLDTMTGTIDMGLTRGAIARLDVPAAFGSAVQMGVTPIVVYARVELPALNNASLAIGFNNAAARDFIDGNPLNDGLMPAGPGPLNYGAFVRRRQSAGNGLISWGGKSDHNNFADANDAAYGFVVNRASILPTFNINGKIDAANQLDFAFSILPDGMGQAAVRAYYKGPAETSWTLAGSPATNIHLFDTTTLYFYTTVTLAAPIIVHDVALGGEPTLPTLLSSYGLAMGAALEQGDLSAPADGLVDAEDLSVWLAQAR